MNNSYPNKLAKLIGHFLQNPGILFPYIKHLPAWKKSPSDYETPWLSFPSIYFLETYIRPWHKVFEYGGGGSTFWFARRAQYVLSVESEKTWHDHISTKLTKKGLKNSSCEFHPISGDHPNDFRENSFFRRIEGQAWDIVLVDCYCGFSASKYGLTRPFALELALNNTKPGGVVVLDDSWMFKELLIPRSGWRVTNFEGPGPCRYGVTSTAVFERLH